ncbi:LysR family transcriptional regulator [Alkalicoccobacillus porphyridii]|uniref:LysR family transcriptional regulator n=1 Tax=Alkalicoccobacillus porphyridii TaxID=2597270 RepID=A0A554A260_9BACI|nr:LysR family transcriptional regulator [Alkalicoccobacillus porphyridii]TSB47765.1 LysR family transcriptional regulator [Alkalicoccobacillus porphyridii]
MEIRVLRYFLTVAREGNFTAAAKFLHVTQPTLSRQIKDLEEELGKKLFVRSNHRIHLTEEGILLKRRAEGILEMVTKLKEDIASTPDTISGDVFIGGGETKAMRLLGRVAKQIQDDHPSIRFHLYSGNEEDVTERLDRGLLDFGILIQPADLSKYHYMDIPAKDRWGVVMRKDSPLAEKNKIRPDELIGLPLICSRQAMKESYSKNEFAHWFGENYDKLNIVTTYNLAYNAAIMVEEDMGYAIVIDDIVNTSSESTLCFKPLEPKLESGLSIVWNKHQAFSSAADLFLSRLKNRFLS